MQYRLKSYRLADLIVEKKKGSCDSENHPQMLCEPESDGDDDCDDTRGLQFLVVNLRDNGQRQCHFNLYYDTMRSLTGKA